MLPDLFCMCKFEILFIDRLKIENSGPAANVTHCYYINRLSLEALDALVCTRIIAE